MMRPSDWLMDDEPTSSASEEPAARLSASFADACGAASKVGQTQASPTATLTASAEGQRENSTLAVLSSELQALAGASASTLAATHHPVRDLRRHSIGTR